MQNVLIADDHAVTRHGLRELLREAFDGVQVTEVGDGHAVLMVRTDRGDLVLDNQDSRVLVWNQTPYQYLKRQSQADASRWVDLVDDRAGVMVASSK